MEIVISLTNQSIDFSSGKVSYTNAEKNFPSVVVLYQNGGQTNLKNL
jgi:hypothetical protein